MHFLIVGDNKENVLRRYRTKYRIQIIINEIIVIK